ncbi:MAG: (4Fe-4S)-binding protein [Saprospiraceae bacterium]|nr:(4Fe-4S)-binding protein [Saprospiraceae bacterium]
MSQREYTNGELTVVWKSEKCIHSANCVKGLPNVFNPEKKPWINVTAATTSELMDQVNKCPSGALSYYLNTVGEPKAGETPETPETRAQVVPNGPLIIHGHIQVTHADGREETKGVKTSFCRCGDSSNKPFCDGTHRKNEFRG